MAFHNLNLQFDTPEGFNAWLYNQPAPQFPVIGSTYHNTYKPNESEWRGHTSMINMETVYAAKGWDRGPHVYLADGTRHDGIFVMTPPWLEGIHAGACNKVRWGVEMVGDFAARPMTETQLQLLVDSLAVLHRWGNLPADVNAHRDCMPGRTCPGAAAYAQRGEVRRRLTATLNGGLYTEDSPIMGSASTEGIADVILSRATGAYTEKDVRLVIVPAYTRVCAAVGVNPVVALAQMCHETGNLTSFWAARPQRNPAGIGVNGQIRYHKPLTPNWARNGNHWEMGISFKEWAIESVPAHVGRLLAYVFPDGQGTPAQMALIDLALTFRGLPSSVRGSAQTLKQLGRVHNPSGQGWASPGTHYGAAIAQWANRLAGVTE